MKTKHITWKVLFVIYTWYVISEIYLFISFMNKVPNIDQQPIFIDYLNEIFILVFLVGFYGYVASKKIFNVNLWKSILVIKVFLETITFIDGVVDNGWGFFDISNTPWWAYIFPFIILPSYIALFLYSFKSRELWK